MARTSGRASGPAVVLAAMLALAACGPGGAERGPGVGGGDAAAREKNAACLDAKDLGELPWGETLVADDNGSAARVDTGCSTGRVEYYRFTLDRAAAVYADAFGSPISTAGGIAPAPCGSGVPICGLGGCAEVQLRVFAVLPAGTWNLFVAGATSRDVGEFVLHVHREPVSSNAFGVIPPGTSKIEGGFASHSGGDWSCDWSPYAWGYYLACPEDPGGTVQASACVTCSTSATAVLGFRDTEGSVACAPADGPDGACTVLGTLAGEDVGGAGLHFLTLGVGQAMNLSGVSFVLDVVRP